jgi:hypothetical protein
MDRRSIARWARAVLKTSNVSDVLGFDPEPIANSAQRR